MRDITGSDVAQLAGGPGTNKKSVHGREIWQGVWLKVSGRSSQQTNLLRQQQQRERVQLKGPAQGNINGGTRNVQFCRARSSKGWQLSGVRGQCGRHEINWVDEGWRKIRLVLPVAVQGWVVQGIGPAGLAGWQDEEGVTPWHRGPLRGGASPAAAAAEGNWKGRAGEVRQPSSTLERHSARQ